MQAALTATRQIRAKVSPPSMKRAARPGELATIPPRLRAIAVGLKPAG